MKKELNQTKTRLSKTSFQSQLFFIILTALVSFVIVEYVTILYSIRFRYNRSETENITSQVDELNGKISLSSVSKEFYNFNKNSGGIPLFLDSSSGGYKLIDSSASSYEIEVQTATNSYTIEVPSYDIEFAENDLISGYLSKDNSKYMAKKLIVNGNEVLSSIVDESYIEFDGTIVKISKPSSLNYLYENNNSVVYGVNLLNSSKTNFKTVESKNSSHMSYIIDEKTNTMYILSKPSNFDGTDYFIFTVHSLVKTDTLLNIISSYYGYIILISILIGILIALFISKAFSSPIKKIEKEINNLKNSDYSLSNYEFKNRELVMLQNVINEVKVDTEEKNKEIAEQNASLQKLNNELLKEGELRSSFIARLSHELKTPLMIISATTEALMSGLIPDDEIIKEYENILNEVDKTTGIIKDIINTYKSSLKETKLTLERFSLNELVDEILLPLDPIKENNKLVVIKHYENEIYIDADRKLIKEAFSNFITNAFKYTKEGQKIEINIFDKKNSFVFEVKNHGSFINEENLEKIWLPFFRENENVDKTSTGMGLYIVKEICTKHGLSCGVENFNKGVRAYIQGSK